MIQVTSLKKSYGRQMLFDGATFTINRGERIGLTGRNGSGKTTLFRLILGEESPDEGDIAIPTNYRIGHLKQTISFSAPTVLKEAIISMPPSDTPLDETYKAKSALLGLGFQEENFSMAPHLLSGGFQVRLQIAKTLLSDPDLLLLDEPTNFLDILSVRWLRQFLRCWKKELMLITHDRDFMDSVCSHTMAIHRQHVRKVEGSTHKLYEQIILEEEVHERARVNDEKRRREIEDFINRFRAKATKARQVQSRIKSLERMQMLEEIRAIKNLDFQFDYSPFQGKWLIDAIDVAFSYDKASTPLISGLNLTIGPKDRIGVIGKNGRGKTTLLRLLAGEITPDRGSVNHNPKLRLAYFGQTNIQRLDSNKTVAEELMEAIGEDNVRKARTIAGIMMFEGDQSLKRISVLSGGEKSRVLLGKLIVLPSNILLLDEPTNHLDMESIDSLLQALESFEGAVVIVTHSEMILKALAERLVIFDDNTVKVFEGGYDDFIEKLGWREEQEPTQPEPVNKDSVTGLNRRELRRKRAEIINARSRELNPLQARIAEIEDAIISLERSVKEDTEQLLRCSSKGQWQQCQALSQSIRANKDSIDALFDELALLTETVERRTRDFEEMLMGCSIEDK